MNEFRSTQHSIGSVRSHLARAFAVLLALGLLACSPEKRYELHGQVLEKEMSQGKVVVKHDEIPGFMPAMTMAYTVKDMVQLAQLKQGDTIAAQVVVPGNGNGYWLSGISVTGHSELRPDQVPTKPEQLKIGAEVPDLLFTNQDGRKGHLAEFQGKALLVTFIYTRCPIPNFCPRLSSAFARIHDDLAKTPNGFDRAHLLTVSIDPAYDKAPVLRKYGLAYLDDPAGFQDWDFVYMDPADLRKLADAFALQYEEQDNQISHSMVVVLIGADGKVAKYWGTDWTTDELEKALRTESEKAR